jgi:hypothetical protein
VSGIFGLTISEIIQRDQQGLKLLAANDSKVFPKYEIFLGVSVGTAANCECQKI